ncbi:MAG: beta strand repeat-containing protein [Acidimicrobiales bacterium]
MGSIAAVPASSAASATTGDGRIDIAELSRVGTMTLPTVGTSPPTTTFYTTTDADGKPWFPYPVSATCTLAAGAGLFAQLNDGSGRLPCGTSTPGSNNDYVVASGVIILPPGTTSLVVQSSNSPVNGSTREAWFGLWTAESPDMADIVERGTYVSGYRIPASVNVDVPIPEQCANPNALAFRMYVADNGANFGYELKWSVDGAAFVAIPPSNISTVDGVTYADDDGDGIDDYLQVDSDGDGISDWIEMGQSLAGSTLDTDGDGVADCLDDDSDGDGTGDSTDPDRTDPVAAPDTMSMVAGTGATVDVGANDEFGGPSLVFTDLGTGTADPSRYTFGPDGVLTYTSTVDDDADSPHTVNYRVCNEGTSPVVCATSSVTITVTDDADPVLDDDAGATPDDLTATTVNWSANATLIDGATLSGVDPTSVGGGAVVDNGDGTFTYTPAVGFGGVDTFTYQVCDDDTPAPTCRTATVSIEVGASPRLGLAKSVTTPLTDNGDGTFSATYVVVAENVGNEALDEVVVRDDLSGIGDLVSVSSTSTDVTVNPGYDGIGDPVLAGPFSLAAGASVNVTVTVTVLPTGTGDVANQATGTAVGATTGVSTTDLSDAGTDPDPDGDGIANEAGENDPTSFNRLGDIPWAPGLRVTKTLDGTADTGGGVFAATFTVAYENTGNEPLTALALTDDLTVFPGFVSGSVDAMTGATANPAFDGDTDTGLIAAGEELGAGATVSATVTVRFVPTEAGVTTNTVSGTATSKWTGATLIDDADAPVDHVADLPIVTGAAVSKDLVGVVDGAVPGAFLATYRVTVDNTGNEPVTVELTDDLTVFPAGAVARTTTASGALTPNPGFDGVTDQVLDATATMPAASSGTITYTVEWTPTSTSTITNQVDAAMAGTITGTTADTTDTAEVTTADIPYRTSLGAAKELVDITDLGGGDFQARYRFTVTNYGTEPVGAVQLTDDLTGFPAPATVLVSADGLTYNPAFDGTTDPSLLTGTDIMAVGATGTLVIDVTFRPVTGEVLSNAATVTGAGVFSGAGTIDASDDGPDPDGNGDGDPSGPGEADRTPTSPPFRARIGAAKNLDGGTPEPDGSFTATYTITVENLGNEPLTGIRITDDLTAFPAGSTVTQVATTDLIANGGFDGVGDTDLLAGTDTLGTGATATITFSVRFTPTDLDPIENRAAVSGVGDNSGVTASDSSVDGTDPDPDGDGVADERSATTLDPTGLGIVPAVGAAKRLVDTTELGAGRFAATYEILVVNVGNEHLTDLSVIDDLTSRFPAGFVATTVAGGTLTPNPGFDGAADPELLAIGNSLPVDGSGTVRFRVELKPDAALPIDNNAEASGTGRATAVVATDVSTDGTDPDPDGNGDPSGPDEAEPTPLNAADLGLGPVLGVAKALTSVTDAGAGSFTATYTFTVENLGNEIITQIQITDDLSAFPADAAATVGGELTPSAGYDGRTQTGLLAGTDTLDVGATATVTLQVTFVPPAGFTRIDNAASASGRGVAGGDPTEDDSTDGADPDPDADGDPAETGSTPLLLADLPLAPAVGAAKALEGVTDDGGGAFTASYLVVLRNVGNTAVTDVQATEDITGSFPAGSVATVAVVTGSATANPAFDGTTRTDLLDPAATLAIGEEITLRIQVRFIPDGTDVIGNTVTVTATDTVGGTPVTDRSDEGTDPDSDGDGDPSGPDEGDRTELEPADLPLAPAFGAAKHLDEVGDNGDGSFTAVYTITVENLGNEAVVDIQVTDSIAADFPAGSTVTIQDTDGLTPNTSYDGIVDTATLTGTDRLSVGQIGRVVVAVTFTPTSDATIENVAEATGTGVASGRPLTDATVDGVDPDPDGDGDPGEQSPTLLTGADIPWRTSVGSAKELVGVTNEGDGSYTAVYRIIVANTGNETLTGVQVTDRLAGNFPAGYRAEVTSTDLTASPAFDGDTRIDLLTGTDTLGVGQVGAITLRVGFTPTGPVAIGNQVEVTATGPITGTVTTDRSVDGADVDPDGDGDPDEEGATGLTGEDLRTTTTLGLAKAVDDSGPNPDGTFWVTYTLRVANLGTEPIAQVQVTDDLNHFGPDTAVVIDAAVGLTANAAFDGRTDTTLLTGGDTLGVAATGSITLTVTFTPASGTVANDATTTGTGLVTGVATTDRSTSGTDPDPDGDGDPGEAGSTEVVLALDARIGAAKALVGEPVVNADGTATLRYRLVVENLGNEALDAVQITDDLQGQLGPVRSVAFRASEGLAPNLAFDGVADVNLLAGTDVLEVGATGSVTFDVTFRPAQATVTNSATAYGRGRVVDLLVSDVSTAGLDPDGNGDGVPDEHDATVTDLGPQPGAGAGPGRSGLLAVTGARPGVVVWAVGLMIVGLGLVGVTRRRATVSRPGR